MLKLGRKLLMAMHLQRTLQMELMMSKKSGNRTKRA